MRYLIAHLPACTTACIYLIFILHFGKYSEKLEPEAKVKFMPQPIKTFTVDSLPVRVYANQPDMAADAALEVRNYLASVIAAKGSAAAILATGNSQI